MGHQYATRFGGYSRSQQASAGLPPPANPENSAGQWLGNTYAGRRVRDLREHALPQEEWWLGDPPWGVTKTGSLLGSVVFGEGV